MASIGVSIHPDPAGIQARRYAHSPGDAFSTLDLMVAGETHASIFISTRPVLDALQAALDAIRADMDAADALPIADWAPGELVEAFGR
jgi:hypothetical protein